MSVFEWISLLITVFMLAVGVRAMVRDSAGEELNFLEEICAAATYVFGGMLLTIILLQGLVSAYKLIQSLL